MYAHIDRHMHSGTITQTDARAQQIGTCLGTPRCQHIGAWVRERTRRSPSKKAMCKCLCMVGQTSTCACTRLSLSLCRFVCALTCLGGCTCAIGAAPSVHTVLFDSPVVAVHAFTDRAPASTLILHTFRYRGKHIHIHIHTYIHTHKQARVTRTNEHAPPPSPLFSRVDTPIPPQGGPWAQ
jgi:hypothetical protein